MANDVFANGREVSCKAADGKSICAFPDVCFTPPENPATPPGVPIPYPNTGMAKDTTSGSKKVKISGKEIMLRNKSYFKKSMGDEAGCAAKKGVITSTNRGKVYFTMWSMNVKAEGQNVVRHFDMTTHNHMCTPGNTVPWPYVDSVALSNSSHPCNKSGDVQKVNDNCSNPPEEDYTAKCCDARKCMLVPYSPNKCCDKDGKKMTPHHVVPKAQFVLPKSKGRKPLITDDAGNNKYDKNKAPCICVEGQGHSQGGDHERIHTETNCATIEEMGLPAGKAISPDERWKVKQAESVGAKSVAKITGCDEECTKSQIRSSHNDMGINEEDDIRPITAGKLTRPETANDPGFR